MVKWLAALIGALAELISGRSKGDSFNVERENTNKRKSDYEAWKKQHGSDWNTLK